MSERKLIRVRDVMNPEVHMIDGMATVAEALHLLKEKAAGSLIVQKRNEDDEFGMLLISDIARHVLGKDRAPERVNVYEIMVKPIVGVAPGMDIRYCARLLTQFDLSQTPVVENEKVVGIVTFQELVLNGLCVMY